MSGPTDEFTGRDRANVAAHGAAVTKGMINRRDPVPLYHQLKRALLHKIETERLGPGDRLPTEPAIEAEYGVSRATIRQALSELVAEGFVERIQGKGTFIAPRRFRHVAMLTSFAEDMKSQGHVPSRRMLRSTRLSASAEVAAMLGVDEGAPCYFLQRLLFADDRRIGVGETWLSIAALKGHESALDDLGEGSLYALLQNPPISIDLVRGVEVLTARLATPEHARLLDCSEDTPVLTVERVTHAASGAAVEWTKTVFPGDRYEYRVEVTAP